MTEHPGFGVMLAWLLDHRELSGRELADRAGLTESEVRAVLTRFWTASGSWPT
ncbi:hypothetical protein ACFWBB_25700 [Streptomyces sp. NPDC060000]|uniref:hypothetical protein n=1 Tax=Streptomyces sp. NPDC060000 TaxID=3347031 RepID=UPI0036BBB2C9